VEEMIERGNKEAKRRGRAFPWAVVPVKKKKKEI